MDSTSTSNANEQHRRIQETEVEMKNNHSKAYEELKHTHSLTNVVLHPSTNYTLLPQPKLEKRKNSKRPNKTSDPLGKENSRTRKKISMKINPTERQAEKK